MDERTAGNVAAARELARRLPYWTVWYGRHTGNFWAMPVAVHLATAPHVEAPTPQELESTVRHMEYLVARAASSKKASPGGAEEVSRQVPPYGGHPATEPGPFDGNVRDRPPGTGSPAPRHAAEASQ
ncbi:hypothetical protein AB0395_25800 [Streptosporangium sp. NPDC051023]|uniref:hypothetical protein n=1 Tax=Streptosporangium sp. NPDC051023 TaxID=3155410 RepID=UPI00344F945C